MEASGNAPAACSAPHSLWGQPWGFGSLRGSLPKRKIRYSSDSPVRQAFTPDLATAWMAVAKSGVSPRQGDVGSADAPRALRQAPPAYEPDEPRGSVLGERTLWSGNEAVARAHQPSPRAAVWSLWCDH